MTTWSKEEWARLKHANGGRASDEAVLAIATCALELAAARGGTMTAERLETAVSAARAGIASEVTRMYQHITALGARNAVLEADLEREKRDRERNWEERNAARAELQQAHADVARLTADRDAFEALHLQAVKREQEERVARKVALADLAEEKAERQRLSELAAVTTAMQLRRERDEAWAERAKAIASKHVTIADNVALVRAARDAHLAVSRVIADLDHRDPNVARLLAAVSVLVPGTLVDHPGAELLEQHRKGQALAEMVRQYQHRDEPDDVATLRRLLEERSRIAHMVDPEQHRKEVERVATSGRTSGVQEAIAIAEKHVTFDRDRQKRHPGMYPRDEEAAAIADEICALRQPKGDS